MNSICQVKSKNSQKGILISEEYFLQPYEIWKRWNAYCQGKGPKPETTGMSWIEKVETVVKRGYDLSAKNPSYYENIPQSTPIELAGTLRNQNQELCQTIERLLSTVPSDDGKANG